MFRTWENTAYKSDTTTDNLYSFYNQRNLQQQPASGGYVSHPIPKQQAKRLTDGRIFSAWRLWSLFFLSFDSSGTLQDDDGIVDKKYVRLLGMM